ncbi:MULTISPECIES: alpha/beta fold hydrolase [Streptomyces]|uniref:alpha/beta fold hydrolase n=1 Tax=Streptomyces TaxID=1883 RepID=UPI00163D301D|nr:MULTISPECIES: alpha/beta hydrolase [Streptomyces]MBC2876318.1 alpha/beta hydrolase [Streptomyces sp. TYQ1024]UBI35465.1 alpha/beta hydrolase [Streptomyces mobaraensis]UKW28057.1 alpha/beta hydrolase [Streptomyces sp. TYQ1024]
MQIELSSGTIDYEDTGGDGPVLVFTHGLPMDGRQWRKVVPLLDGYRRVLPTLPLGGHRRPMRPDADLSHTGIARLLDEFLERLGLDDVTLVLNDWGGAQFMISEGRADRLARMVLVACEAFDNFPPGPAKALSTVCRLPGGVRLLTRLMSVPAFRDHPKGYGGMSRRGLPPDLVAEWFGPASRSKAIRRDFAKFATSAPDRGTLLRWSERLRTFDRPVLVVWATEDRLMPREHGPRLAELYPRGRLVEIEDSSTLIPEDQPEKLARVLLDFLAETGAEPLRKPTG